MIRDVNDDLAGRAGNPKIHVMGLITGLSIGGAEKMLAALAMRLPKDRFEVSVCSLRSEGEWGPALRLENIPVFSLKVGQGSGPVSLLRVIRALFQLKKLLRKERPDILQTSLFLANVLGRLAGRWARCRQGYGGQVRVPCIVSNLRVLQPERLHLWGERFTIRMADHVVTVCDALRRFAIERLGASPERVTTIYNGVEQVESTAEPISKALGLPMDIPIAGMIGRLDRQKGVSFLLQAVALLKKDSFRIGAVIIGDGPERKRLEAEMQTLSIEKEVRFLGSRPHAAGLIKAFDLLVLPSLWEGFPNAVLEAMAAGCPVVATPVVGVPEVARHEETALLVPPGDPKALAAAMRRICEDRGLAHRLAERAAAEVKERFTVEKMVKAYEDLYMKLVNPSPSPLPQGERNQSFTSSPPLGGED